MGQLTTHVLDTAHGCPAANMAFTLSRVDESNALISGTTNADGRVDKPLLQGANMQSGLYVLRFEVAAYFRARGIQLPDPPFFDVVTLEFGIADESAHYHVPLLVSPWAYSTYRGS